MCLLSLFISNLAQTDKVSDPTFTDDGTDDEAHSYTRARTHTPACTHVLWPTHTHTSSRTRTRPGLCTDTVFSDGTQGRVPTVWDPGPKFVRGSGLSGMGGFLPYIKRGSTDNTGKK